MIKMCLYYKLELNMKKGGIVRNRIRSYNQFLGDEMDKRKSHNDSRGEILDKINGK